MADEYALVPEKEVRRLRDDIDAIKKNPLGSLGGNELVESIKNLNAAINSLTELFKTAAEDLKIEERESQTIATKVEPLLEKIDMIMDQNKKIARGIVAVADMIGGAEEEKPAFSPRPPAFQPRPAQMMPPSLPPPPSAPPAPPAPPAPRKGLF
jgi:hypothetical protein